MSKFTKNFTVLGTFVMGWGITIAGFIAPPLGEIDNSVLVVLGLSLLYCGGAIGLKAYILNTIQNTINKNNTKK